MHAQRAMVSGIDRASDRADGESGMKNLLDLLQRRFPESRVAVGGGDVVSYRTCQPQGKAVSAVASADLPVIVLLHGIGSGAASWLPCALELAQRARVIAWNAPGYGASTGLPQQRPCARDYAARLQQMLTALGVKRCVLVGHSLGAMMACAFVSAYASAGTVELERLVLLSAARGYGCEERRARGQHVAEERLAVLAELGVAGTAAQRSHRLLSRQANATQLEWVRWNMAQLNAAGYAQAVQLLCGDAIENHAPAGITAAVHCGSADGVTPPEDCSELAARFGLPFHLIDGAGHACYVERPAAVAAAILPN